jgi:glycosyltransferase involved in cell wall biosynthesis
MGLRGTGGNSSKILSKPLHIGFAAQGGAGWAGGAEYIRNLARAVRIARPEARLTLLCGKHQQVEWEPHSALFDGITAIPVRRHRGFVHRLLGSNRELRRAIRDVGIDFLYPFTYDNGYNLGAAFPLSNLGCSWAGWIPDFQHRHLPQLFSEKERNKRDAGIEALVNEAPKVVLSSESAAADFRRFHPAHAGKEMVLTFGTFPSPAWYGDFTDEDLSWLPSRYFVICNQFWSHKNHALVLRALEVLARRDIRPTIVCTGALVDFRQPDQAERLLQQMHRAGIASQVMILGLVSRRLQIEIMRRSLAVVQPSLFEGWSTVVEDARVLGKPALLSDLDVHREQNPPGVQFFPREDEVSLATLLEANWKSLQPGPDRDAEQRARQAAESRMIEIGQRLLTVAEASTR